MSCGALHKSCKPSPWGRNGPTTGSLTPIALQWEKHREKYLLPNQKAQSFYILCVAMYSIPLNNSCQLCPWGPDMPRPKDAIIFHRLITEIHETIFFSETVKAKACLFGLEQCHVELYKFCQPYAPGVKNGGPIPGAISSYSLTMKKKT